MATITANLNAGDGITPDNELIFKIYGDADAYTTAIATTGSAINDANVSVNAGVLTIANVEPGASENLKITSIDASGNESAQSNAFALPASIYLSASLAYSFRDLGLGATNVIIVRRTGGATPTERNFTPTEILDGTLATWVGVGNDGFVTTWYDQVGTNHMTQTIALRQPQIVENGSVYMSNGLPILRRTRDDIGMISDYAPNGTNRQVFTVIQSQYLTVKKTMLLGRAAGALDFAYSGEDGSTNTLVNSNITILTERRNGASFTYTNRDNVYDALINKSLLNFTANFNFSNNGLSFGYRPDQTIAGFSMYDMQEFILFETPETVAPIETNINNYYSVF